MVIINASKIDEMGYATDMLVNVRKSTLEDAFREIREAVRNGANEIILTVKERR